MTRSAVIAGAAGVLLLGLAAGLELAPGAEPAREALRDGFGPEGGGNSRSVRLLRQLGIDPTGAGWPAEAEDAPSSKAVDAAFLAPGQWLVSVAVPEESLRDPERGLLTHPDGRGREWERVAWLSVYDGRRLVFATRVGLRLHGGASGQGGAREGYRVIFRPSYGLPHMPPGGPLDTAKRPPDRFVIRRSQTMPQAQPVAFAIARRVGSIAPSAVSARFVLNGELRRQAYELTEHVSREGWGRAYFGHDDFRFVQFRATPDPVDTRVYREVGVWLKAARKPLLLADVAARVDTEDLIRHILTIVYCGTDDWAQGAVVMNLREPNPRWFFVHWDLDQSFRTRDPALGDRRTVDLLLQPVRSNEWGDLRARLFRRLLREDPAFVVRFTEVAAEVLNHRLTDAFLQDLIGRETRLSVRGAPFGGFDLGGFFRQRGDVVFDAIAVAIRQERPHRVEVRAPRGIRLRIDGYEYRSQFTGRYFHGQTIRVEAADRRGRVRSAFRVNGMATPSASLRLTIDRETSIVVDE